MVWSVFHEESLHTVDCLICSCKRTRHVYHLYDQDIVRCAACGFVFVSPRLERHEGWTRYNTHYFEKEYLPAHTVADEHYDPQPFTDRARPVLETLERLVGHRGRLLEVGVGAGFFLREAQRVGWECSGTEIMDAAIDFTSRVGLDVRKMAAEEMDFPECSFDAVAMLEVIEHLYDPREALRRVHRALRPNGVLLVTTPNFMSLSRAMLSAQWGAIIPAEHLFYFTSRSLRQLLAATGFEGAEDLVPQPGYGVEQTMNPACSGYPRSRRTRFYAWLTRLFGQATYEWVQRLGAADTLVMAARRAA
jgi:2-polyprenyl-3-methyl-5-hydroxy-6-metoxy-1,4-benzoquinol methylase